MPSAPRTSSASTAMVGRGVRGVARGKGNVQNFPAKRVARTIPGRRVGTVARTVDQLGGAPRTGRSTGFVGKLRSGATIRAF